MSADDPRAWLAQVRAGAEAATEGPWFTKTLRHVYVGNRADGRASGLWSIVHSSDDALTDLTEAAQDRVMNDADFIASARTTVPALAAMVEAVLGLADAADFAATCDADQECGTVHAHRIRTTITALIPGGTDETEG